MKLKYKKIIILISMCTMGIGLVTFSITKQSAKQSTQVEKTTSDMVAYNPNSTNIINEKEAIVTPNPSTSPVPTVTPAADSSTAVASAKSAEVKEPTDELQKDVYTDVNKLVTKFLNAKLTHKAKTFKNLVNDVKLLDMSDIKRKTKYIEKYKNITCYTKQGPEEGSYIVYAYHEVKLKSIKTLAPAMNWFYVKKDSKGAPYIYIGKIDDKTEKYLDKVNTSDEIEKLIASVDKKMKKATDKDKELEQFYLKLEESARKASKND